MGMAFRFASLLVLATAALSAPAVLAAPALQTSASATELESRPPAAPLDLVRIGKGGDGAVLFLDLASLRPGPQPTVLVVSVYPQDQAAAEGSLRDLLAGGGAKAWAGGWSRTTIICARHVMYMGGSSGSFDAEGQFGPVFIRSGMNDTIEANTPEEVMWAAACDNRAPSASEHLASLDAAIKAVRAPTVAGP